MFTVLNLTCFSFSHPRLTAKSAATADFGVSGYPTLKTFDGSTAAPEAYDGGRTKADLIALAKKMGGSSSGGGGGADITIDEDDL